MQNRIAMGTAEEEAKLKAYMRTAAVRHKPAKPLDWEYTACPSCWEVDGVQKKYEWYSQQGILYGNF